MEGVRNKASPGLEKGKRTVNAEKKGKQVVVNNHGDGDTGRAERDLGGGESQKGGERGGREERRDMVTGEGGNWETGRWLTEEEE